MAHLPANRTINAANSCTHASGNTGVDEASTEASIRPEILAIARMIAKVAVNNYLEKTSSISVNKKELK
jgi:hypothetical protein